MQDNTNLPPAFEALVLIKMVIKSLEEDSPSLTKIYSGDISDLIELEAKNISLRILLSGAYRELVDQVMDEYQHLYFSDEKQKILERLSIDA